MHPLYARAVEAEAARAVVIPAQPSRGMQVTHCPAQNERRSAYEHLQPDCEITRCGRPSLLGASAEHAAVLAFLQQRGAVYIAGA